MSEIILEGRGLTRLYTTDTGRTLTACHDVSLSLREGETLGIVGESGCGKSTLLRLLTQLERPDKGQLFLQGKDITNLKGEALRQNRRNIQMVLQDPGTAFFSRIRVKDAVSEPLRNFEKLSSKELDRRVDELLELVQLPVDFKERYPHAMSGGQRQRLGIARALALNPQILICDESTSALDVLVQKQIIQLLVDIQRERKLSMVFVCHDLALVQSFSHRIMIMYLGNVVEILPGKQICEDACHPYSRALLDSVFTVDMDFSKPIHPLEGEVPSPLDAPDGCVFHTRCPHCTQRCREERPKLHTVSEEHVVACHLFE